MKKGIIFLTAVVLALTAAGCFSPYTGDNGGISIDFGVARGENSRVLVNPDTELSGMRHEITLRGPDGTIITRTITGGGSLTVGGLSPGDWTVKVRARGPKPDYFENLLRDNDFPEDSGDRILRALGEASVTVKAGATAAAEVTMISATEVSSWAQLQTAVSAANRVEVNGELAPTAREEIIVLTRDMEFPYEGDEVNSIVFGTGEGKNITLMADRDVTVTRAPGNEISFFELIDGALTLGRPGMTGTITLDGNGFDSAGDPVNSGASFVVMTADGTEPSLVMNEGVTLTNNNYSTIEDAGGGVAVYGGSFTMNGGTIDRNRAGLGGGVAVLGGSFTMNGGTISDNPAAGDGGGVYVAGGTFTMNSGTISGNTASGNAMGRGGGVYIDTGKFDMNGGTISGNNASAVTQIGEGGGVYILIAMSTPPGDAYFIKTGGVIYGAETGADANIAEGINSVLGRGAAVYYDYFNGSGTRLYRVRETTLNGGDNLSTDDLTAGWETP